MDGARFAKLCRESGVQGGKLNSIAIDIIFSKVKAKVWTRVWDRLILQLPCYLVSDCLQAPLQRSRAHHHGLQHQMLSGCVCRAPVRLGSGSSSQRSCCSPRSAAAGPWSCIQHVQFAAASCCSKRRYTS